MRKFELVSDDRAAQGRKGPNNEGSDPDPDLAFILVDPTVQVKDRPYQRHVRSHVMKDFQRRKEAREGHSKHASGSKSKHQIPKVALQLQGVVTLGNSRPSVPLNNVRLCSVARHIPQHISS